MNKRLLSLFVVPSMALSGCASMQDTMDTMSDYAGRAAGATIGAGVGYLACHNKSDLQKAVCVAAGAGAGWAIGSWIDDRRTAVEKVAKQENLAIVYQEIDTSGNADTPAERGLSATINDQSMFASGSAQLTSQATKKLKHIAEAYRGTPQRILIIGHTDATGSGPFNQTLSEKRAQNVARLFLSVGIPKEQLYYQGAGMSRPIATNTTSDGRAQNRRVELVEISSEKALLAYSNNSQRSFNNLAHSTLTKQESKNRAQRAIASNAHHTTAIPTASVTKNHKISELPTSSREGSERITHDTASGISAKVTNTSFKQLALGGQPIETADLSIYDHFQTEDNHSLLARLSPVSNARANEQNGYLQHACYMDNYRPSGNIHALSDGKPIKYSASDYMPGLNRSILVTRMDKNLVGLGPVAVLKDYSLAAEPNLFIYTHAQNQKTADLRLSTHVNVYEGADTVLYRAFINDTKAPVQCFDLVFDKSSATQARDGRLFYQGQEGLMVAKYQPARPTRQK